MAEQAIRAAAAPGEPEKKGWLFKWTNYLKGYQRRWFVLSNGLLSYYRNQAEMAHTCRGTISLLGALIHTADSCTFVISNGGTQTFHIRAHDEIERQSWVTALELAKAKAIRATESDEEEETSCGAGGGAGEPDEPGGIARELSARFHDLRTCSELVARHGAALQRSLADLEVPPTDTAKQLSERATLFRISCNAMMNVSSPTESDEEEEAACGAGGGAGEPDEPGGIARELSARFHDLRTCSELVARHGAALQRSLADLEVPPTDTAKQLSERATLFRISCNAMMNVSSPTESDEEEEAACGAGGGAGEPDEPGGIARELSARFHDLRTCSELVARHGAALQRSLADLEVPPTDTAKQLSERATLFRISCNAMMNVSSPTESDEEEEAACGAGGGAGEPDEPGGIARELSARFHDLRTCSELVARHGAALQRSLADLEVPPTDTAKQLSERATLFRISCNAMMNVSSPTESDEEEEAACGAGGGAGEPDEPGGIARELSARFHDLRTCSELVARHGAALQRSLADLEVPPTDTAKQLSERATLFRISCNAMMNVSSPTESDEEEEAACGAGGGAGEPDEPGGIARELSARFHDLRTCSELVARHGAALQRSLADLEVPPTDTAKQLSERATLFRISCNAMMNVSSPTESDEEEEAACGAGGGAGEPDEPGGIARELSARFHDLRTCSELVARHGAALQRSLADLEVPPTDTAKQLSERATLFRISCNAMMNVSSPTESDEEEEAACGAGGGAGEPDEPGGIARELSARFHDLRTCSELVARHGAALQRSLADLEVPPTDTAKQLSERATLFRISCNAMMNACSEFMTAASMSSSRLARALQHEREQKMRLQEVVEQLARQHDNLEKTVTARNTHSGSGAPHETDEDDEHEFFDAQDESAGPGSGASSASRTTHDDTSSFIIKLPVNRKCTTANNGESSDDSEVEPLTETQQVIFVEEQTPGSKMGGSEAEAETRGAEAGEEAADEAEGPALSTVTSPPNHKIWPHVTQAVARADTKSRRCRVPEKPNYPLSLWSIMKNCIGKELSKIPIPVNFSEPLSMLQRLTEDYEYSSILDAAAACSDPAQQLALLSAYTVSSYATTACRTNKPFNPLLGETYECDRWEDLGWRSVSEQVSHHPPMLAQWCEGASGWRCWQEFTMTSKFRGKYLQIIPLGGAQAHFPASGNKYSWRKVSTTVHNIIVGRLWVDNHGDMDIRGEEGAAAGYTAHLKYLPYSYFSKDTQRKVSGVVKDPFGTPKYVIQGYWDSRVEIAPVTSSSADNTVCKTGKFTVAWERIAAPPDSDKWYNFTLLAAQLNEPEAGVAPTDSRHRPDQRLMEEGLWDEANAEKLRLEEEQRARRRGAEAAAEGAAARGLPPPPAPRPAWFARESTAAAAGAAGGAPPHLRHLYTGDYWRCKEQQDWSRCPSIF